MQTTPLILATSNAGKIAEISDLLVEKGYQVSSQADYGIPSIPETGLTFIENALLKTRHICEHTHEAALGDDSGLVVPALQGAPGLYSARYAGPQANASDNNHKLLNAMQSMRGKQRKATFVCVLTLLRHSKDPEPVIAIGRWHGQIAQQASGKNGFGYDPIFIPNGCDQTAAELLALQKRQISHRGLALKNLLQQLQHSA